MEVGLNVLFLLCPPLNSSGSYLVPWGLRYILFRKGEVREDGGFEALLFWVTLGKSLTLSGPQLFFFSVNK